MAKRDSSVAVLGELAEALRGQPNHANLGEPRFVREARTSSKHCLHSVRDEHPGIYEVGDGGDGRRAHHGGWGAFTSATRT
jgi:hypothetical protein